MKNDKKHTPLHVKNWTGYAESLAASLQRGFLYDDWIKTPADYDATESGFTECNFNKSRKLRLYYNIFPKLENFMCHSI